VAAVVLAIHVRLAAENMSSGGNTIGSTAPAGLSAQPAPQGKPDWVTDPLASPFRLRRSADDPREPLRITRESA
jgi:hypothetical protein